MIVPKFLPEPSLARIFFAGIVTTSPLQSIPIFEQISAPSVFIYSMIGPAKCDSKMQPAFGKIWHKVQGIIRSFL